MPYPALERIARSRTISTPVILAVLASIVLSGGLAQGRVDSLTRGQMASTQSPDTIEKVTGGGTVLAAPTYPTTIASFGVNARRAPGFMAGGAAKGKIHYNRHRNSVGRHVKAPVTAMQGTTSPRPPNETGGNATLVGDCTVPGADCPAGTTYVLVYVEDNADKGAGSDVFRIFFCTGSPLLPPGFNGITPPADCGAPEGGTLRTGNIQIRGDGGDIGEQNDTAAAAGVFPTTPTFNGVELAGGIYGVGIRTTPGGTTYGDLHAEFTGISLIGLYQIISVDGWVTSMTVTGGTVTLTGTASLDMGDGPPPTDGLPMTGTMDANGLTLTVGGSSLPTLPKTDGYTDIE
jgi:hypothetical protein